MDDVGDYVSQIVPDILLFPKTASIFFFHGVIFIFIFSSEGPFTFLFIFLLGFDGLLLFLWLGLGCIEIEKVTMLGEVGEI